MTLVYQQEPRGGYWSHTEDWVEQSVLTKTSVLTHAFCLRDFLLAMSLMTAALGLRTEGSRPEEALNTVWFLGWYGPQLPAGSCQLEPENRGPGMALSQSRVYDPVTGLSC